MCDRCIVSAMVDGADKLNRPDFKGTVTHFWSYGVFAFLQS